MAGIGGALQETATLTHDNNKTITTILWKAFREALTIDFCMVIGLDLGILPSWIGFTLPSSLNHNRSMCILQLTYFLMMKVHSIFPLHPRFVDLQVQ
jgi:hypothetical protein